MPPLPPPLSVAPPATVDSLGCDTEKTHPIQQLRGDGLNFYRSRMGETELTRVDTSASERGMLLGISLLPGHRRRIFRGANGRAHDFAPDTVYLRRFDHDYRADLWGPFDFLLLELSPAALEQAAGERRRGRATALREVTACHDPVLSHLGAALAPVLNRPQEASPLFLAQMATAIETYVLDRYAEAPAAPTVAAGGLSPVLLQRAQDMLLGHLDGNVSVAEIATACRMSRSHFIRAFRHTTGQTPHQWLLAERVAIARRLLRQPAHTLAQVAALCGFADQSHFTRVFTQREGCTPGRWRRSVLG